MYWMLLTKMHLIQLTEVIKGDLNSIPEALYILSIIRKLERVGDQSKNIAEEIIFYVEAKILKHFESSNRTIEGEEEKLIV